MKQRTNPYDNEGTRFNLARLSDEQLCAEVERVLVKSELTDDDDGWLAVVKAEQEWRRKHRAPRPASQQIRALREFVSTDAGAIVVLAAVQSTTARKVTDAMTEMFKDQEMTNEQ